MTTPTKTVLLIAPIYPPGTGAGAHRTIRFAKYLKQYGYSVIVITKTGCDQEQESSESLCTEGVEVFQVKDPIPRNPAAVSKRAHSSQRLPAADLEQRHSWKDVFKNLARPYWQLFSETPDLHRRWSKLAADKAIELSQSRSIDLIYTTGPPHSVHIAGKKAAGKTNLPLVLDFRDPWGRKSWQKNKNPLGRKFFPWFERHVVLSSSHVIANNSASLDSFQAAYRDKLPKTHFSSITNGFDPDELIEIQATIASNSSTNADNTFVLLHAGSLYGARDPENVIRAVIQLRREGVPVQFRQVGHCDQHYFPTALAENLGCPDAVTVIPSVPRREALQEMARADIHLLLQPNAPQQVPGKIFETLMFDQPILAVGESPPTESLVQQMGGAFAASTDVNAIMAAVRCCLSLAESPELRRQRSLARHAFDGRELTRNLASIFDCVLQNDQSRRGSK